MQLAKTIAVHVKENTTGNYGKGRMGGKIKKVYYNLVASKHEKINGSWIFHCGLKEQARR